MPKRPPSWNQPTLFSDGLDDATRQPNPTTTSDEGNRQAIQDNRSRTVATATADVRPDPEEPQAPPDNGAVSQGTEDQPRGLDAPAGATEAGNRPGPDRLGSAGDSSQGNGGSFV